MFQALRTAIGLPASAPVAVAPINGESTADAEALADFEHFLSVQGDAEVVRAACITNGMHPDEIVRRVLTVSPRVKVQA
jgi:hypothetical protein